MEEPLHGTTDGELLAAFAQRDNQSAFGELVQRYAPMVHGVCRRVVRDHHEAEDVAQVVFLTLARKAGSLRREASVGGWLHTVARGLAQDARKARYRRQAREAQAMREQLLDHHEPAAEPGLFRERLDDAIGSLSERYRQPLVLFHLRGCSLEQTASQLRLNLNTVCTRLARARELLRKDLVRGGVAVGSVGALTNLLSAEAGAAALPVSFVSATVQAASLATAGKLAAGVAAGKVSAHVVALTEGALNMLFWNSVKTAAVIAAASAAVVGSGLLVAQELAPRKVADQPAAMAAAQPAPAPEKAPPAPLVVAEAKAPVSRDPRPDPAAEFAAAGPTPVQSQTPQRHGGAVVLFSRNRYTTPEFDAYGVSSYSFRLGLRNDDPRVRNSVHFQYGNGGPEAFNVSCVWPNDNRIVDLGNAEYDALTEPPESLTEAGTDARVQAGHVYAVRVQDAVSGGKVEPEPLYVKVRVLDWKENDRVLVEWAPLQPSAFVDKDSRFLRDRREVAEEALARLQEIRQAGGGEKSAAEETPAGRYATLIERRFCEDALLPSDPYRFRCYFSFVKGKDGYDGAVSLELERGGFKVNMVVGQRNRIVALGAADFSALKSSADVPEAAKWADALPVVTGHVYVEHLVERRYGIDRLFAFQVLDAKPGRWVVLQYKALEGTPADGWAGLLAKQRVEAKAEAEKRLAELRGSGNAGADGGYAVLIARDLCGDAQNSDPNRQADCYSFPKAKHRYDETSSLLLDRWNNEDRLRVLFLGGQANRLKHLGKVALATLARPGPEETGWSNGNDDQTKIQLGHVYLEHCRAYARGLFSPDVDQMVAFEILDHKPGQWVILRYRKLPAAAAAAPQ